MPRIIKRRLKLQKIKSILERSGREIPEAYINDICKQYVRRVLGPDECDFRVDKASNRPSFRRMITRMGLKRFYRAPTTFERREFELMVDAKEEYVFWALLDKDMPRVADPVNVRRIKKVIEDVTSEWIAEVSVQIKIKKTA
jgi:hypothetical protein